MGDGAAPCAGAAGPGEGAEVAAVGKTEVGGTNGVGFDGTAVTGVLEEEGALAGAGAGAGAGAAPGDATGGTTDGVVLGGDMSMSGRSQGRRLLGFDPTATAGMAFGDDQGKDR